MRFNHVLSTGAVAMLVACSSNSGYTGSGRSSPSPTDSTVAGRVDTAAGRNVTDSIALSARRTRDSIFDAGRSTSDSLGMAAGKMRDSAVNTVRSSADSVIGLVAGARGTAPVRSADGRDLGTLNFADAQQAITITGTLRGLAPGRHGIHIHMAGRCEAPGFMSAGDHWNPTQRQHGSLNAQGPHQGDLQNITVGADSNATVRVVTSAGSLRGMNPLLDGDGASIVVHTAGDDRRTDPSGNSGTRVACGVINLDAPNGAAPR